jgi:hypothetical protein
MRMKCLTGDDQPDHQELELDSLGEETKNSAYLLGRTEGSLDLGCYIFLQ